METVSDVIIHLRDEVVPLVSGETRELVNDAIYALKAIITKQHLDKRRQSLPAEADEAWRAIWPGLEGE